jgi:hypothetical protein
VLGQSARLWPIRLQVLVSSKYLVGVFKGQFTLFLTRTQDTNFCNVCPAFWVDYYCYRCPNGHVRPFLTSTLQDLSNGINTSDGQRRLSDTLWVVTLEQGYDRIHFLLCLICFGWNWHICGYLQSDLLWSSLWYYMHVYMCPNTNHENV